MAAHIAQSGSREVTADVQGFPVSPFTLSYIQCLRWGFPSQLTLLDMAFTDTPKGNSFLLLHFYVHLCSDLGVHKHVPQYTSGGQRTTTVLFHHPGPSSNSDGQAW